MSIHDHITADIARAGFSNITVADPKGTFAYTVGFTELGHPEILISGMRGPVCHRFFWDLYDAIKAGKRYKSGEVDTDLANLPTAFKTLNPSAAEEFCCQALFWYEDKGKTPTFLQMVLPDKAGRFPWDAGFDAHLMRGQRHLWVDLH
jgi:hypothetical protein